MLRASASKLALSGENVARRFIVGHGFWAGVLAVALAASTPACAFAQPDGNGDDSGQLDLNSTVLVNDSASTGSAGDFAIRGSLFSADLSARVKQQRAELTKQLTTARDLDFAHRESSTLDYRPVRAGLFEHYSSQVLPRAAQERTGVAPAFYGVVVVVAVPLVLLVGVFLGRFWTRRKRVAS